MFSQYRRRPVDAWRSAAHVDGVADQFHFTHLRMLDFNRKIILAHLRISEYFIKRVDWRGRNILFCQPAEPIIATAATKDRLQFFDQSIVIFHLTLRLLKRASWAHSGLPTTSKRPSQNLSGDDICRTKGNPSRSSKANTPAVVVRCLRLGTCPVSK